MTGERGPPGARQGESGGGGWEQGVVGEPDSDGLTARTFKHDQ